ncbi:S24 family peptidase, partial [Blautia faecis]|uniref:S24 family peptidase n=1 Tax=Blautia faecis TaxID=871665 RepID=UPI0028A56579
KCSDFQVTQNSSYHYAGSAGTGNYLEDSVKETYDVGHLAPEQTDFGVRISGDSMEPLYHTGDVAWIQKKRFSC